MAGGCEGCAGRSTADHHLACEYQCGNFSGWTDRWLSAPVWGHGGLCRCHWRGIASAARRIMAALAVGWRGWTPSRSNHLHDRGIFQRVANFQLVTVDPKTGERDLLPLAQASQASTISPASNSSSRGLARQSSSTKLRGRNRESPGVSTRCGRGGGPHAEISKGPAELMWWKGRLLFCNGSRTASCELMVHET